MNRRWQVLALVGVALMSLAYLGYSLDLDCYVGGCACCAQADSGLDNCGLTAHPPSLVASLPVAVALWSPTPPCLAARVSPPRTITLPGLWTQPAWAQRPPPVDC